MARYSNEFKERAVARLLPPESAEITRVSQEIGVSVATLERWRADARLQAVITTAAMDEAQRNAWCREQGLFPSDLQQWRESATAALSQPEETRASPQQTRDDRRRIKELERDLRRKEKALAETTALLVLSKRTGGDLPTGRGRMISLEDRRSIARAVEQGTSPPRWRAVEASLCGSGPRCPHLAALESRCGPERGDARPQAMRVVPAHALSPEERARMLQIANEPRFAELPPARIVPMLADEGVYIASESSFSRVLRVHGQTRHRGRAKAPQRVRPPSTHVATGPRQVFMTYLPATMLGRWFYLYLILDLYSRKTVGFEVHESDSSDYAVELLRRTALTEGLHKPVLHGDNGATLKATTVLAMMNWLGLKASYSRLRVSDDNAFVGALFRTSKYRPQFPAKGFTDLEQARQWASSFVHWYNHDHRHSGIRYVSPPQRQDHGVLEARHALYLRSRAHNPRRWARHTRNWNPVAVVTLNSERDAVINAVAESSHNTRSAA